MASYNKVSVSEEKVSVFGEKVSAYGETTKITPLRISTYKRIFPYISLHTLTEYDPTTPLPFALGYGQGFKRTELRTPHTDGGALRETNTDTAGGGFESRPVLTGSKQALRPLIIHSGHRKQA